MIRYRYWLSSHVERVIALFRVWCGSFNHDAEWVPDDIC